jgi:hypothetical protein
MLKNPLEITILTFLALILSNCGTVAATQREQVRPETNADGIFAEDYYLQDPSCQTEVKSNSVSGASVYVWQGDRTRSIQNDFSKLYNGNSISSNIIANTWFNYHQRKECTVLDGVESCESEISVVENKKYLRVCDKKGDYERKSFEGIALTTIATLDRSHEYYQSLFSSKNMHKANLLVLPKIEKHIEDQSQGTESSEYSADNLTYTSSYTGNPLFVVYPKSRETINRGLWKDLNLWEIPWAIAHEFGHHVHSTHSTSSTSGSAFLSHSKFKANNSLKLQSNGEKTWRAVGEAFADLFAFYSLGGKSGYLEGIECFENDREVESSVFVDGTEKNLTFNVLEKFQSSNNVTGTNCKKPNFGEAHTIGAILARGVDQIFEAEVGSSAIDKSELLLQWSEKLAVTQKSGSTSLLNPIADALSLVSEGNLSVCQAISKSFSGMSQDLLELHSCQ